MAVHLGFLIVITLASWWDLTQAGCAGPLLYNGFVLTSRNHPNTYPDNYECLIKLFQVDGANVKLTFSSFAVEVDGSLSPQPSGCTKDYLKVYDSATVDEERLMGTFCGDSLPGPLTSSGNAVLLHFSVDGNVGFGGYNVYAGSAQCSSDPNLCGVVGEMECHNVCDTKECPTGFACVEPEYECLPGLSRPVCVDIDECESNNGMCAQTCANSIGSFACSCSSGYKLSDDGLECDDIDECESNNGMCAQTCTNTIGSFVCSCSSGYLLGDDELGCDAVCFGEPAGTCPNEGTCLEPDHCECPPGFSEPRCDDIDECRGQHCCSHVCMNDEGSYHCACPRPLILKSDLRTCKNPNAPSHALPDTDDRGKACPGFAGHKPAQTPAQPSQSQRNRNFKSD